MRITVSRVIIFFSLFISLITSCSQIKNGCPPDINGGNPGSPLNSAFDEIHPTSYDNNLFIFSDRAEPLRSYEWYSVSQNDESEILKLRFRPHEPTSISFADAPNRKGFCCFAATNKSSKMQNSDIYFGIFENGALNNVVPANDLNSAGFEGNPFISSDGGMIILASDRPGSIGETDLYVSRKNADGSYLAPEKLPDGINTASFETTPFVDENGILYFSSNRSGNFDIYRALSDQNGNWLAPSALKTPVNSAFDEKSPIIKENNIIFTSNRPGGCGAADIYSLPLCHEVFLNVSVQRSDEKTVSDILGTLILYDQSGNSVKTLQISSKSDYHFPLKPNQNYTLVYEDKCNKGFTYYREIMSPCSDTSVVKIIAEIEVPPIEKQFTFEEYKVPFFVTGYYLPNTEKNLETLRMKFSYNLIGNSDSTKYIENPGPEYNEYTSTVEKALNDATEFIINSLDDIESTCYPQHTIEILVTGYSDPRGISAGARYDGPIINDADLGIDVGRSTAMTNELLSKLRAYFTAKELQNELSRNGKFLQIDNKISWKIDGKGVDESEEKHLELKRRVNIIIKAK